MTKLDKDPNPHARLGLIMMIAAWTILLGMLTLMFHNLYLKRENPNSDIEGVTLADGSAQVVLKGNYQNQFLAQGSINNVPITFLLDTGATDVVISKSMAEMANLKILGKAIAQTANGRMPVYLTRIEEIKIGSIVLKNVTASISEGQSGEYALLGMSALRKLDIQHSQNQLTLTLPRRKK